MASTTSSANASSSSVAVTVPLKKYEVFISFRGEDTRANFTSFLHAALCRNYIETYIDYRIQKGEEVWKELVKAIKESSISLVVFSENYASSTWCLNELLEIMECRKNGHQDVIPVFYKTEPSHVRKQSGSYQTAMSKHKKQGKDKIQKWKDALLEAANLSGFDSHRYRAECDLIEDIIKAILQKLNHKYTNELGGLYIFDENFSHVESLLRIDSKEVRMIGIWGMGGIGKTTLAAAIFHKVSPQYDGSCFLENVTEESKRHGLNYIFSKLLSMLLMEDLCVVTLKVIPSTVIRRLKHMKALIVLDDVNTSELVENLVGVGRDWLGAGSRVIITTRDKHVLSKGVDEIHEVKEMNFENSLRLFSLNAFNKTHVEQGYEEASKRAIVYAKGIPLALRVLGSFLRSKSEQEWDSALAKLKKIPNAEIQKVLRLSYDGLDDTEKNIFLDIACFFKGNERKKVTKILNACGFFADIGIRNLLDKALIRDSDNFIEMHGLIQEMGREIVREESIKNPGQRSRLWDPEEVCDVLTNNRGTKAVEGIVLDMTKIKHINLSSKAFKKMPNLRILVFKDFNGNFRRINSVYLPMGLHSLPKNLRYFGWDGYPLKFLPPTFCPEMLVELSLQDSNVEKLWNGVQNLPNLEILDLNGSTRLIECPNLSRAPNIKHVNLSHCERLPFIDPSIFSLQKLEVLNVGACTSLKSLCSSSCPPSLRSVYALGCINLQEFSVTLLMPSATGMYLNFGGSGLNELPSSILHIRNLENFSFPISDGLMDLPENFAYKITLCDPWNYECDRFITLRNILPSPGFRSVRRLVFTYCYNLIELPDNISLLSSLESLVLLYCAIITLPQSIKYLPCLKTLEVGECEMIQSIPSLPQSIQCFHVWNCESLQTVSEPFEKPNCTFLLFNCIKLDPQLYDIILKSIELGANLDSFLDHDHSYTSSSSALIYHFLPVISGKEVGVWFHYHSIEPFVTIDELPLNLLGIVFYLVVSQVQSCYIGYGGCFGCECYLESSGGEKINITSFFVDKSSLINTLQTSLEMMCDHVVLWYDEQCCKQIMETIKGINDISNGYNPMLTFEFFAQNRFGEEVAIKECGFRWIYPSEDQNVSEFDEQEETVPSTEKFKQRVFGTPSNQETGDLSHLLEELLHIGFGGDLM